ncbi:hypothetical protein [Streptomyces tubercidicus]|uniref:hypothetical protein n=1 Tax=Streptomyces tubercidicus TaxID=47759 RepID=UPI0034655A0B
MALTRRDFAKRSAYTGAGVALAGSVGALGTAPGALAMGTAQGDADRFDPAAGYGPLLSDPAGILALPQGFSYRVITRSGVTKLVGGRRRLHRGVLRP